MNGDVVVVHFKAARTWHHSRIFIQWNVKNFAALVAIIMAMLFHVRTKPRRAALQLDLLNKPALHQSVERVVNRCVGNFRHLLFGADENFISRRMVALLQQHVVNALALRRKTKAARVQTLAELGALPLFDYTHEIILTARTIRVKI